MTRGTLAEGDKRGRGLTVGALSRLFQVDPKTIHNWAHAEHLRARRTRGRHLRFARSTVAAFARRFEFPWFALLPELAPSVLYVSPVTPSLGDRGWSVAHGLHGGALYVGGGTIEVAVLHLDAFGVDAVQTWVAAAREYPASSDVALVGVSKGPLRRRAFLAAGGDVAVAKASPASIDKVADWIVGRRATLPRNVVVDS